MVGAFASTQRKAAKDSRFKMKLAWACEFIADLQYLITNHHLLITNHQTKSAGLFRIPRLASRV